MRSVPFGYYQERVGAVLCARREALGSVPDPEEGRPHPDELTALVVHALETHGARSGPLEMADEFLDHLDCHWHELGVAVENLRLGIGPPTSGAFNNDAYGECDGGLVPAQVWGMLQPGDPARAASRAAECARITHCGSAVEAARFLAAAQAEAFTSSDLGSCLRAGLAQMTPGSRAAACVQGTLTVAARESDPRRAWTAVASDWHHPDATDVLLNLAGALLALTGGGLDWARTLQVVLSTGGDAPAKACACAAMLASLGSPVEPAQKRRRRGREGSHAAARCLRSMEMPGGDEDFVERLSRLAVACARAGEAEFAGAPYFPSPGPPVAGPARLFARYGEDPVLAPGEERVVFLELADPSESVAGSLEVEADDRLRAAPLGGMTVPGQIAARAVNVSLADDPGMPGVVRAEVRRAGRPEAVARFGFRRASRWVAVGPFEASDGNGLDRAYLQEGRLREESVPANGPYSIKVLRVSGDAVDVDGVFGSVGPRVIYLMRVVQAPSARPATLRICSSDGIKLWLNGRRVLADHRHAWGSPDDYVIPASLKKGPNRLAVKLARCSRQSAFRLRITRRDSEEAMLDLWDPF